jgi:hypothetical protein
MCFDNTNAQTFLQLFPDDICRRVCIFWHFRSCKMYFAARWMRVK